MSAVTTRGMWCFAATLVAAGCSDAQWGKPKTLYERLGGEPGLKLVVDDFVDRAAANPRVNFTRRGTNALWDASPENVARVKVLLFQFIGKAAGGSMQYEGRGMKAVHAGMGISDGEFDAIVADLRASLAKARVSAGDQEELLTNVELLRKDIVEAPGTSIRLGGAAATAD